MLGEVGPCQARSDVQNWVIEALEFMRLQWVAPVAIKFKIHPAGISTFGFLHDNFRDSLKATKKFRHFISQINEYIIVLTRRVMPADIDGLMAVAVE